MFYDRFTHKARTVVNLAKREAQIAGSKLVGPEHVLLGVLGEKTGIGARILNKANLSLPRTRLSAKRLPALEQDPEATEEWMSKDVRFLYERTWLQAQQLGHTYISTEHLLLAVLVHPRVFEVLMAQHISGSQLRKQLLTLLWQCHPKRDRPPKDLPQGNSQSTSANPK